MAALAGAWLRAPRLARADNGLYELTSRPTNYESTRDTFTTRITPFDRFYIRNHFDPPAGDPKTWAATWKLELRGLVDKPRTFTLAQLDAMKQTTIEAVLQCAGNGRGLFRPRVPGVQWQWGAMGNAEWTGVRLGDLLAAAGVAKTARFVQLQGMSVPPGMEKKPGAKPMKFFPHFLLRDLLGWTIALGVLATLAAIFPWELGEKADPFAPAFRDIKPEWYFMFMFQTLKLVPGGEILGVEYEALPILGFGLGGLLLILVPFLDKGAARNGRSPLFTALGVVVLAYVVGMTTWGYRSAIPVLVVVGTVVVLLLVGLATRGGKGGAR